ncbi:MAG: hypothetical protein GOMPHAMPRED_001911 [Gomphillus americanus]|uniref:Uncharacterized protein n=1 Tax=Gomphillus americanus TaxID=1940652 RepID=A0A8H3F5T4_9LECA|nr:MAG: hypothetical protein GOMPHAMPRED_001911 [Gomphillus americanus]
MALATEVPDLAEEVNGDPILLAEAFLTATATPTWYTALPSDIQGFVSSVANAEATIAAKDSGAAPNTEVWTFGVILAAGAAGMLLL